MPRSTDVESRFGPRLKALRKARGLSLQGLASVAFVSRSYISEIENGIKTPSVATAKALDTALQAGAELIGMVSKPERHAGAGRRSSPKGGATRAASATAWWAPGNTIELIGSSTRDDLVMDRRKAAQALGGMIFGAALLEPLDRWLSAPPAPAGDPPRDTARRISEGEVALLEHTARLFRSWDHEFGGGLRRKAVIGQLNEVAGLLNDPRGPHVARLFRVMAQLAETVATMSWDSGNGPAAQRYYALALRAAKEGGDRGFAANVLAGMARQLLYLGHPGDALELVRIGQENSAGHVTATVRAMLHTREAWAYAGHGRLTALRRATDRAQGTLADADPVEDPYWIDYFDAAELAGVTGGRLLELAHHDQTLAGEASDHIERAIQLRNPRHLRSLALDKIGLAEARLLQGEVEEAARLGHEATDTAERTASDRVRLKLAEFHETTQRHNRVPDIAGLQDRVQPLLSVRQR